MKVFVFSIIVGACIIIAAIILRPQKTPDQIKAEAYAEQIAIDSAQKRELEMLEANRREVEQRNKIEAQKSDAVKAAEIQAKAIDDAKDTYIGVEVLKFLFK